MRTRRLAWLVGLGLSAAALPGTAQTVSIRGDDPNGLRELVGRLFLSTPPQEAELIVGALPNGFPLAVPNGWRVVGSLAQRVSSTVPTTAGQSALALSVILDSPLDPAASARAEDESARRQGWTSPQSFVTSGPQGFQPSGASVTVPTLYLCSPARDQYLVIAVRPLASGSDVRLTTGSGPGPCVAPPPAPTTIPFAGLPIPALTAPDGVTLRPSFAGPYGPGAATSAAVAETTLPPGELETTFARQLTAAGWVRRSGSADPLFAVSVWDVPGGSGDARGMLSIVAARAERRLDLIVQVTSPTSSNVGVPATVIAGPAPVATIRTAAAVAPATAAPLPAITTGTTKPNAKTTVKKRAATTRRR